MRELKFRAYDKEDKQMIVDEQDFIPLLVTNKGVFRLDPHHQEPLWVLAEKDRFEIMQCTGLRDQDGREIYEGDILKWEGAGIVTYSIFEFGEGCLWVDGALLMDCLTKVVAGNRFENPELLEETK